MKKVFLTISYIAAAIALTGCAKTETIGPNDAYQRYFKAWMHVNHPEAEASGLGVYVIKDKQGDGIKVGKEGYVLLDYKATDLEGNITSYTDKQTAKQLGKYDTTSFYGPKVMSTTEGTMPAGLAEALIGMKEGGRKKVIIPSWLMSHMSYETEEEYLASSSSSASTIYDITVRTYTDSIQLHEINLIEDYIKKNPQIFNSKMVNDTTGFYYQPLSENISTEKFEKDTTIYINYTGRLLNGLVFDTTIEKVAKDNGIYSSSRTYGPTEVNWGEKYDDLTLGSSKSTVIPGFALTLWHMHPMEKGMGVFYSPLGYSFNGSGSSIPGYAPLIFEIEIVPAPEN